MEEYKLNLLDFLPVYEEIDPLYNYYDEKDYSLNKSIFLKKEFNELQTDNKAQQKVPGEFKPLNHQSFASRFLSQYTPYDKLLAFHEVGTGKTCLSSLVAEIAKSANPFLKEAIFVVKNDTLKRNVVREISEVCTNGKYLPLKETKDPRQYTMLLNRLIGTNYMTYTYYEMKNQVQNMTDKEIDEYFSNRIIIIDEAHNLCIKSEDSVVYSYIHRLLHNIHNYKILLLTATPMRDTPKDIALILNLLLPVERNFNDKTFLNEYFDKNNNFLPEKRQAFTDRIKGLISYIRASSSAVKKIYEGENIKGISSKVNIVNMLSKTIQLETYKKAIELDIKCDIKNPLLEQDEDAPDDGSSCFYSNSRQASIFVAPDGSYGSSIVETDWYNQSSAEYKHQIGKVDSDIKKLSEAINEQYNNLQNKNLSDDKNSEIKNLIGLMEEEIDRLRELKTGNKMYKESKRSSGGISEKLKRYLKEKGDSIDNIISQLDNLSIKYANIIRVLLSPESKNDKVFIYSNLVSFTGANLLASLLEFFGFVHVKLPTDYDKSIKDDKVMNGFKSKGKPQYLLITGTSMDSRSSDFLINKIYNNPLNHNGDYIKVVIASKIIGEGSSFKHTRQLHIVSPGWNETEMVQAQGRAIRAFSHDIFPPAERYVKIFKWCAIADNNYDRSIDYILYKICSDKDKPIKQIERLLKESAVDCAINYKRNMNLDDNQDSLDTDKTRDCDYDTCVYKCIGVPQELYMGNSAPELIYDSYNLYYANEKLQQIKYKIEELFRYKFMFDLFELLGELRYIANDVIIVRALKYIIEESIHIKNKYNITSYLREDNNFYFLTDTLHINNRNKFLIAYYNSNPIIKEIDSFDQIVNKFECRYFDSKLELLQDENLSNDEFLRIIYSIDTVILNIMIKNFVEAKYKNKNVNINFRERFLNVFRDSNILITKDDKLLYKPENKKVEVFETDKLIWRFANENESSEYLQYTEDLENILRTNNPYGYYGKYSIKGKSTSFDIVSCHQTVKIAESTGKSDKAQLPKGASCIKPGGDHPVPVMKLLVMAIPLISTVKNKKLNLNIIEKTNKIANVNDIENLLDNVSELIKKGNKNASYLLNNLYSLLAVSDNKGLIDKVKDYPQIFNLWRNLVPLTGIKLCGILEQWFKELNLIIVAKK